MANSRNPPLKGMSGIRRNRGCLKGQTFAAPNLVLTLDAVQLAEHDAGTPFHTSGEYLVRISVNVRGAQKLPGLRFGVGRNNAVIAAVLRPIERERALCRRRVELT